MAAMKRVGFHGLLLAAVVGATGDLSATPANDVPKLELGEPFPNLTLPAMRDGQAMSISDYRGKRVVLHIFASW